MVRCGRSGSFKVTEIAISASRKLVRDFLLVFHCNYVTIFYRLRDITTYWSKISVFFVVLLTPVSFGALARGSHGT